MFGYVNVKNTRNVDFCDDCLGRIRAFQFLLKVGC